MSEREAKLERTIADQDAIIAELRELVDSLRRENEQQQFTIERLTKMTFGRSSERHIGPTLFDALEPPAIVDAVPLVSTTPQNELEKPAQTTTRRGHGRRVIPDHLPVERKEIDLPDDQKPCPCCGGQRIGIGFTEPSRRLDYRPAKLFVEET